LNIKHRIRVDLNTALALHILRQPNLILVLDIHPFLLERRIVRKGLDLGQQAQVLQPVFGAQFASDQFRKERVGLVQPTTGGDTVGDVGEFVVAKVVDKVLEEVGFDETRVEGYNKKVYINYG
jgi:hypothetical protein